MTKYNATSAQIVPMQIEHNGELFDVAFLFERLNDDLILNYFKSEDADELDPAEGFFDRTIVSAEGVEGCDTLEDLRSLVAPADKRAAIREGLLAALRKAPGKAEGKLNYKLTVPRKSHRLESFFNGTEVETTITLNTPDADHVRVHQALMRGAFPVKFGEQKLFNTIDGLHALYRALYHGCWNYEDDQVPAHHALLVIGFHLNGYRAVITKK